MANQNTTNIVPPTVIVPGGYSNSPLVGKIQQLYDANNNNLYKKLSPYTENSGFFSFGPRQPYVYVNPNQGRKGINGLKRFESRAFPFASTLQDTIRVSKFLIGGNGILFLTKQFLLQKSQAFNETRIYNPLSPILAASTKINPFSDKNPLRHIDTSGGLLGALASIVGVSANKPTPPKGTVGLDALSDLNKNNSKGLIRAGTAISAYNNLSIKNPKSAKGGFLASLPIVSFAKSLFGGFGPLTHPGEAKYRADEGAYGIFLKQPQKFSYFDKNGNRITWGQDFYQRFEAGGTGEGRIRKGSQQSPPGAINANIKIKKLGGQAIDPSNPTGSINVPIESEYKGQKIGFSNNYYDSDKNGVTRYGYNIGKERSDLDPGAGPYQFSDILSIYTTIEGKPAFRSYRLPSDTAEKPTTQIPRDISVNNKGKSWEYRQEANNKFNFKINSGSAAYNIEGTYSNKRKEDPNSGVRTLHGVGMGTGLSGRNENKIEFLPNSAFDATGKVISVRGEAEVNEHKKNIINSLNDALKQIINNTDYDIGSYESRVDVTYNKLVNHRYPQRQSSGSYEESIKAETPQKGLSTTGKSDTINSLDILVKSTDEENELAAFNAEDTKTQTYYPYKNDFIAFYFHDLVNDNYIPFRATVKGIQENATANWSDINYIGRADKLYNYTGFTRTLGFNFKVVAMSIKELLPMWKRINYLVGLTKPALYITDSSFIIPPLITITIGDLYKEQPVILKTVNISISEEAIWELTPELNNESNTWKYLNDQIVWKDSGGKYAQFPTECEIQISTDILEAERPRTGGRNFGGGVAGGGFSKQLIKHDTIRQQ